MKHNPFRRTAALFIALVMILGIVPVVSFADTPVTLLGDANSDPFLDFPSEGGEYLLDLSDKTNGFSFRLFDDGGADGDYSYNYDGQITVTAPVGFIISVTGGGALESVSYDYLLFYDGGSYAVDAETYLGEGSAPTGNNPHRYAGAGSSSPGFDVGELVTSDYEITIKFHSDSSVAFSGFALMITLIDVSDSVSVEYAYDKGDGSDPLSRIDYAEPGSLFTVKRFDSMFQLPAGKYLAYWEDDDGNQYSEGDRITVDDNMVLWAVLEVMPVIVDAPTGSYAYMSVNENVTANLTGKTSGYTFTLYDDGGPNGNYSNSCNSTFTVLAPTDFIISVSGGGNVESERYDYLQFFDGDSTSADALGDGTSPNNYPHKYAGSNGFNVGELRTTGNALTVQFVSDTGDNFAGFALTITLIDPSAMLTVSYVYNGQTVDKASASNSYTVENFDSVFTRPERKMFSYWEDGDGTHYAEGEEITLTGDLTLTAVLEDMPIMIDGGEAGWYAYMARTSPLTADLTDKEDGFTFTLYDNGGPNGNYASNCLSTFTVLAPDSFVISVSGSGQLESVNYDFLLFYDGDSDAADYLGEGSFPDRSGMAHRYSSPGGGNVQFSMDELTTSDNALTVKFRSDSSGNDNGFALTITLHSVADQARVTYVSGEDSKSERVSVDDPYTVADFDSLFTLPPRMTFSHWEDADGNEYDEGDVITLTDSITLTACFDEMPAIVDGGADGFYTYMKTTGTLTADISDKDVGFVLHVYDDGGPNANYSKNCDSILRIVIPEGMFLSVSGSGNTEYSDKFSMYQGEITVSGGTATGNLVGWVYNTSFDVDETLIPGNVVTFYFTSDNSVNFSGLNIQVELVEADDICAISFDAGEGSGSMGTQYVYTGAEYTVPQCAFIAPVNEGFAYYLLGTTKYRPADTITVTDDLTLTAIYDTVFTVRYVYGSDYTEQACVNGNEITLPEFADTGITLPYRKEFVDWQSGDDHYNAGASFIVSEYTTFTATFNDLPYLQSDADGDFFELPENDDVSYTFNAPTNGYTFRVYDCGGKDGNYPVESNGSMTFYAPEGWFFSVTGSFNLDSSDHAALLDPVADIGLGTFYGEYSFDDPVTSSSNALQVGFISGSAGNGEGFEFYVTMYDTSKQITVTIYPGEGSGDVVTLTEYEGISFTLPDNSFTAPNGMGFVGYTDGLDDYHPGDTVTFDSDVALNAVYESVFTVTYNVDGNLYYDSGFGGDTITIGEGATIPASKTVVGWTLAGTDDVYENGDSFVVTENVEFIAILDDLPLLNQDEFGNWYVNMQTNEYIVVDVSDKPVGFSFLIYDDGGANRNYNNNNDSTYLEVVAPDNCLLSVRGRGQTEGGWDYLRIYDGSTFSEGTVGEYTDTDGFTISPKTTTGNCMLIEFESDSTNTNYGFVLEVTIVPAPAEYDITFEYDNATDAWENQPEGKTIVIPDIDLFFELPDGKRFVCWTDGVNDYDPEQAIKVEGDMTLTAVVADIVSVTFYGGDYGVDADGNDASDPEEYYYGQEIDVPDIYDYFFVPNDKYFDGWLYDGNVYYPGEKVTITYETAFNAEWRDMTLWEEIVIQAGDAHAGDSLSYTLSTDLVVPEYASPVEIPQGVTVTIDLNGVGIYNCALNITDIFLVHGTLIIEDSSNGGGYIIDGSIRVFDIDGGSWSAPTDVLESFGAKMIYSYSVEDPEDETEHYEYTYSTTFFPYLLDAMKAAASEPDFEAEMVDLPYENTIFDKKAPVVVLLADATVPDSEEWEIETYYGFNIDLNGFIFTVDGTLSCGTTMFTRDQETSGWFVWYKVATVNVVSSDAGAMNVFGTLGCDLETFSADTFNFDNCTVEGNVYAYAGYYYINGTVFTGKLRFENVEDDLSVEISGESEIAELICHFFNDSGVFDAHLSVDGNSAIGKIAMYFYDQGGALTLPCVELSGGYYGNDPRKLAWGYELVDHADVDYDDLDQYYCVGDNGEMIPYSELKPLDKQDVSDYYTADPDMYEDYFSFGGQIEQYADQADWEYSSAYGWRVKSAEPVDPTVIADLQSECEAFMGAAADSSHVRADLYFTIPDGYDAADFTVEFNGVESDLGALTANGYRFSINVPAKNLGDQIPYVLRYKGEEIINDTVSVADYLTALAASDPDYADFAEAMLAYGAAAQLYFNYETDDLVSDADLSLLDEIAAERFDAVSLNSALLADDTIPVKYSAMNVTFLSDTTLSIAFRIRDGFSDDEAIEWVNENVTLAGADVEATLSVNEATPEFRFVIIKKQNIAIEDVTENLPLVINGTEYPISVMNYIAAVEESGNGALKTLVRALYAYAQAAKALNG